MAGQIDDVITIDNFDTRMSRFDVNSPNEPLYGLVDMGSNGIRFSISDLSPPSSRLLRCIYRERAGISLYDALHQSKPASQPFHFSKDTIAEVSQTLSRFRRICDGYGVRKQNIGVFATEAMRTARNKDEMLQAISAASGLTVDILSPDMESLFGAMGARSGFHHVDGLFMDLGGGSVQMTYVNSQEEVQYDLLAAKAAKSMPYGAAKLTAALSAQGGAEQDNTGAELAEIMKETFEGMKRRFPRLRKQVRSDEGVAIYFCGGGFRGYGSMLMHTDPIQPYPIASIGGYTVPGERFIQWQEMLQANEQDGKIFGMSKRRRDQFPAIALVVRALVQAIPKIKEVTFCSGGNREGVLYMKLPPSVRESHPILLFPGLAAPQTENHSAVVDSIIDALLSGLPTGTTHPSQPQSRPAIFTRELLSYVARNTWLDMGNADDINSTTALHVPISGPLASLPGLTHETRAVLALIMCSRWGNDLGPVDKALHANLAALVGQELSWWCECLGTVARLLAIVVPAFPADETVIRGSVSFACEHSFTLGKRGHKLGTRLRVGVAKGLCPGVDLVDLGLMFKGIGKGRDRGWRVEAEVVVVDSLL